MSLLLARIALQAARRPDALALHAGDRRLSFREYLALIKAFHARGVPVAQVYGSTETGPVSIPLRPDEALKQVGSVGRPAPGVRLRWVDVQGADVVQGTVGEIWLQAPNLMRGYHHLPVGTGFVSNWFATDDLAWVDEYGQVSVVGCRGCGGRPTRDQAGLNVDIFCAAAVDWPAPRASPCRDRHSAGLVHLPGATHEVHADVFLTPLSNKATAPSPPRPCMPPGAPMPARWARPA